MAKSASTIAHSPRAACETAFTRSARAFARMAARELPSRLLEGRSTTPRYHGPSLTQRRAACYRALLFTKGADGRKAARRRHRQLVPQGAALHRCELAARGVGRAGV